MQSEQVDQAVREVFSAVLQRNLVAGEDVARAEEPLWDSLKQIEILFALEEQCGVHFSQDELASLDRMGAIIERIKGYLEPE